MYKCQICGQTAPPRTPLHKITVQTRQTSYPFRPAAYSCWKQMGNRKKFTKTDDPGGRGSQIIREVIACPKCAEEGSDSGIKPIEPPRQITVSHSEMIEAYLRYQLSGLPEDKWAVNPVVMMTFSAPPAEQWQIILELIEKAPDDDRVLGDIAAGPLEGLLGWHGEKVISWVEEQAQADPKFARTLTGVWKYMMPEEIWQRVQRMQSIVPDPLHSTAILAAEVTF